MRKIIAIFLIATVTGTGTFYYLKGKEKTTEISEKVEHYQTPVKEVEVFDLAKDKPDFQLKKSGISQSANIAYISPQINGRITDIFVKVGQQVKKGDSLAKLGDSLGTDMIDLNLENAKKAKSLANQSKTATKAVTDATSQMAETGMDMAYEAHLNALESRENAKLTFYNQYDNALQQLENAEEAYEDTQDAYYDAKDALEASEEDNDETVQEIEELLQDVEYNELITNVLKGQLQSQTQQAAAQIQSLKMAMQQAEALVEQGENAIESLKVSARGQFDQLDFAISTSLSQYESTINQFNSAQAGAILQQIGAENGVLQSDNGVKMATLNEAQKTIKSPITGKVTSITAKKDNFSAPGQIIMVIEDDKQLKVTGSLTPEEATMIHPGTPADITVEDRSIQGTVVTINPTANEMTKKIDVEIMLQPHAQLLSNSIVDIYFKPASQKALYIPLSSISLKDSKHLIQTVNSKNEVEEVTIKTGKIIGAYIEVLGGLKGNEKILKYGNNFVEKGEKVRIANDKQSTAKIER